MADSSELKRDSSLSKGDADLDQTEVDVVADPDAEFGGHEARKVMEKKLLRKLDARYVQACCPREESLADIFSRMCILIIIYILNYVRRQTT